MAEISLRDYLAKLDDLLGKEAYQEVIDHCRHILQYYPKNVEVYLRLGRALLYSSRWDEAGEVFRRTLSVYPDDYVAHAGLSEVYQKLGRLGDAIWHMERAYEQKPNNPALIDALRNLYRLHNSSDPGRIQLTAGAAARQALSSGLYNQAIDTLQQAFKASPERVDLQLLLAQTYWASGYRVEAAETAIKVLQTLPNCLEANRILTMLWLQEDRPSDAQRYLSRVEAADPYLGLEIAQGTPPPDDAIKVEELDYRRKAQHDLVSASPDWMQAFGDTAFEEQQQPASVAPVASVAPAEVEPDPAPEPDWMLDFTESTSPAQPLAPEVQEVDEEPEFFNFDAVSSLQPEQEAAPIDLDDFFSTMGSNFDNAPASQATESGDDDAFVPPSGDDWLNAYASEQSEPEQSGSPSIPGFTDMLASAGLASGTPQQPAEDQSYWLMKQPASHEQDSPDLFGENSDLPDWLSTPAPQEPPAQVLQTGEYATVENIDPLAWLKGTGIEIIEEQPAVEADPYALNEEMVFQDPSTVDPLAWLKGTGVEVIDDEPPLPAEESDPDAADPYAWMKDTGVQLTDDQPPPVAPKYATQSRPAVPQPPVSQPPASWIGSDDLLDEALDIEALTSGDYSTGELSTPSDESDEFSWQQNAAISEQEDDFVVESEASLTADQPDWLNTAAPAAMEQFTMPDHPDNNGFEWLSSDEEEQPDAASSGETSTPDWLGNAAPAELQQSESTEFEWFGAEVAPDSAQASAMPDWLAAAAPVENEASASGDLGLEWLSGEANEQLTELEWNMQDAPAATSSTPDWLSQMAPAEEEPVQEQPAASGFSWEAEVEDEEPALPVASGDMPDWLSQMAPAEEEPVQEQPPASGFSWEAEVEDEEPAVPVASGDMPDWLSQMAPAEEEPMQEQSAASDFSWEAEVEDEEGALPVASGDMPDWLSQMAPAEEEPVQEQPAASGFSWEAEVEDEKPALPVAAGDMPDWLSQMAPAEEEPVQEQPAASGFSWEAEVEDDDAAMPVASGDMPDWLSQMAPAEEEPVEEQPAASGFSWEAEVEDQEDALPVAAGDMPDWLSQMAPAEEEPVQEQPATSGFSWEAEAEDDDAAMPVASDDMPDWLSQMAPAEEEPVQEQPPASGFSWEAEVEDDDAAMPVAAGDMPDWLSQMAPVEEEPAQEQTNAYASMVSEFDDADDAVIPEGIPSDFVPPPEHIDDILTVEPLVAQEATPLAEALPEEAVADAASVLDTSVESELDWMGETPEEPVLDAGAAPEWVSQMDTPNEADETAAEIDWGTQLEEPAASVGDMPDWLSAVKPAEQSASDFSWEAEETEFASEAGQPNWLSQLNAPEDEPLAESEAELDWMAEEEAETWQGQDNQEFGVEAGSAFEEIVGQPHAENAPDWLNAMVPGLDLDYEAEEDAPIEQSFIENSGRQQPQIEDVQPERTAREYDWLTDIVDEETRQGVAVTPPPPAPASRSRFAFTRLPAWLRRPRESSESTSASTTSAPLTPDWLRDSVERDDSGFNDDTYGLDRR